MPSIMASGSILKSLSDAKVAELKNQVVELLLSCDGHRLELHQFKKEYKDYFRMKFEQRYVMLKSYKLKDVMAELDDVISLKRNKHGNISMKLKDGSSSNKYKTGNNDMTSPGKSVKSDSATAVSTAAESEQVKLDSCFVSSPSEPLTLPTSTSSVVSSPAASLINSAASTQKYPQSPKDNDPLTSVEGTISDRVMLKAHRCTKKEEEKGKIKDVTPVGSSKGESINKHVATVVSPQTPPLSPAAPAASPSPPSQATGKLVKFHFHYLLQRKLFCVLSIKTISDSNQSQ